MRPLSEVRVDILAVVATRAAMFAVLFLASLSGEDSSAPGLVLIYGLSTVLYLATWISSYRASNTSPVGFLLFFQFLVEILVEAAIFYSNDGYFSDYGLLFILTILSAGLFFQYWGAMVLATLATGLHAYAGAMHLGHSDIFLFPPMEVETVQVRFFFYATLFYLVALLASQLSRRLIAVRKELVGTHKALDLYQFSSESIMNELPTGLIFLGPEGTLKYRNDSCEEWLGRKLDFGMTREQVFEGLVGGDTLHDLEITGKGMELKELEIETPSGRPLHVQIKSLERGEEHVGTVLMFIDFTHERKMARELLRSERMAALGNMSARIAHEIRNPLASISGSAQMLQEVPLGAREMRLLSLIVTESFRLDRVLTSLLDYARDRPPSYRDVSIAATFKKIRLMLEKNPNFNPDLATIDEVIEGGDIRFSSDQDILEQVLLNVALNALQALMQKKGNLALRAKSEGKSVIIEVMDSGCGMTEPDMAHAFEPFFTTKAQGTGLGLAICLHAVQSLGGKIQLKSEKSVGTAVTITLPLRQA